MATFLRYSAGTQFLTDTGTPLALGTLNYYTAGTTDPALTFSDSDGLVQNANPIALNGAGRLAVDVHLTVGSAYKETLKTSAGVTVTPWPVDNIEADGSSAASASVEAVWARASKTTSSTLTTTELLSKSIAGNTTSGNIGLTLPSAVTAANGHGGIILKSAAANTLTISAAGGETVNGVASITLTAINSGALLLSDGAAWTAFEFQADGAVTAAKLAATLVSGLTGATALDRAADYFLVHSGAASAPRKILGALVDKREPDALHSLAVINQTTAAPPGSPSEGDRYIVAAGATGAWSGWGGRVASYFQSAWVSYVPTEGWLAWDKATDELLVYTGSAWLALLDNAARLGVASSHGAKIELLESEALVTLTGAYTDAANLIPNGCILFAVSERVVTLVTSDTGTSFSVGVPGETAKFGSSLGFAAGGTNRGHIGPTGYYADTNVRISPNAGSFTGGSVRVVAHYALITPPTS